MLEGKLEKSRNEAKRRPIQQEVEEVRAVDEAKERLVRGWKPSRRVPHVWQAQVDALKAQLASRRRTRSCSPSSQLPAEFSGTSGVGEDKPMRDVEPSKKRLREDYIPASVEDLVRWMCDRQKDLQEAMLSGRIQDVTRLAEVVADGGAQLKTWIALARSPCGRGCRPRACQTFEGGQATTLVFWHSLTVKLSEGAKRMCEMTSVCVMS